MELPQIWRLETQKVTDVWVVLQKWRLISHTLACVWLPKGTFSPSKFFLENSRGQGHGLLLLWRRPWFDLKKRRPLFLLVINSNFGRVSHRFQDGQFNVEIAFFLPFSPFNPEFCNISLAPHRWKFCMPRFKTYVANYSCKNLSTRPTTYHSAAIRPTSVTDDNDDGRTDDDRRHPYHKIDRFLGMVG